MEPAGAPSAKQAAHRGDKSSDRAFHVSGAAPVKKAVDDSGGEGIDRPTLADGDHVGMSGEAEIGRGCGAKPGIEIIHRVGPRFLEPHALAAKAEAFQRPLQHIEGAELPRRHARAANQGRGRGRDHQGLRVRCAHVRKSSLMETFGAGLGIDPFDDHRAVKGWAKGCRRARACPAGCLGTTTLWDGTRPMNCFAGGAVDDAGGGADEHAHGQDRAFFHQHALDHFGARVPMKQLSSMMTGAALQAVPARRRCPRRRTGERSCRSGRSFSTVAQVSTMVPSPTRAPTLTKDGINMAPGAMKAEWRTTDPGTARKPACVNWAAVQRANLEGTSSHDAPPPDAPGTRTLSLRREGQQHGFLQPVVDHPVRPRISFSATRTAPPSRRSRTAATAPPDRALSGRAQALAGLPRGFDLSF